jgi:uncharacterized DUF497 family protein
LPIITWNRAKSLRNVANGRPPLSRFRDLDLATAVVVPSPRQGEDRLKVIGFLDGRLHVAIVLTGPNHYHVISLRAASRQERRAYATRPTS